MSVRGALGRASAAPRRVVIVYKTLPHYRVDFYEQLREKLATQGVHLDLIVGQPDALMEQRKDTGDLPWATRIRNRYISVGRRQLVWQPCVRKLRGADLVIVEQASRLILNYFLHATRRLGGPKLGLWGHGVNLDDTSRSRAGEWAKRGLLRRTDWWFCYTEGTKRIVTSAGFPAARATVVQNAIDTGALREARASVALEDQNALRSQLGIGQGPVCLWLSSIYPTKRPDFMVAAFDHVRAQIPDAELLVVGDGPSRGVFEAASESRPWVHVVGTRFGRELALYASLASIVVNPGLVGLTVLDSFALELPMVTCDLSLHSPEVDYLVNGENSVVLPADTTPGQYGSEVAQRLSDANGLDLLRRGCRAGSALYTVEAMADRFAAGVVSALAL